VNIPLDNLYDWIAGIAPDTVIYRFYPHGSKNIANLTMIDGRGYDLSWIEWMRSVPVIVHDQEPLDFNYYNMNPVHLRALLRRAWPHRLYLEAQDQNPEFWQFLSEKNVTMVAQPTAYDRSVLLHSEQRSTQLEKYSDLAVGAYWWSHAMISRDWYRFAEHDPKLKPQQCYPHDFNIYCRAWSGTREYRLEFLKLLAREELEKNSRITFCEHDQGLHYREHQFVNRAFRVGGNDLVKIPLSDSISSDSSASYSTEHYNSCWFDVILETLFDDTRWHLTEKSLRPIACGKPFVMVATPGSLDYLRSYGFLTFGSVIDESYDQVTDPGERLAAIVRTMRSIASWSDQEKQVANQELQRIADHNRKLFFSDDFARHIVQELKTNLLSAYHTVRNHHMTGKNWDRVHQLSDAAALDLYLRSGRFGHHQDIEELATQCQQNRIRP